MIQQFDSNWNVLFRQDTLNSKREASQQFV